MNVCIYRPTVVTIVFRLILAKFRPNSVPQITNTGQFTQNTPIKSPLFDSDITIIKDRFGTNIQELLGTNI